MPESQDAQSGFDRLLIRTAIDPGLCQKLLDSPDSVFAEFDLTEEQQDLLRHPDHRLLPLMGAMLARQGEPEAAPPQAPVSEPITITDAMSDGPPALPPATPRTLPDVSLALTVVPCARVDNQETPGYSYAVWVNPLPAGVDPSTLPPPAGAQLPGRPFLPLHIVVQLCAIEYRDSAGRPQVGLSASFRQSSNVTGPPAPESKGLVPSQNPRHSEAIVTAAAHVRSASGEQRYHRLIDLIHALRNEEAS
jgi:hypothetical protein